MRPEIAEFDIERRTLGVCFGESLIEHEHDHEQAQREEGKIFPKKIPPPTPDRREGRLFPPEQF
jgi:hypothetical protein